MKVICRHCQSLVQEEEAIRLTMEDYESMKQDHYGVGWRLIDKDNYIRYTQICKSCYDKLKVYWWLKDE